MPSLTITEALSELNLIKKKIEKKKPEVLQNLVRYDHMKDTFDNVGGSKEFIATQLHSVDDLRKRFVRIRSAIAKINTETYVTIKNKSMTINEWLNWRRDQAEDDKKFHEDIARNLKALLDTQATRPNVYKADDGTTKLVNIIVNTDLSEHLKAAEEIGEVIENLDGQLSLKNATTVIEV